MTADDLPDDADALKALVVSLRERNARLEHLVAQLQRAQFGKRSEKLDPDQLLLGLEDIAIAQAEAEALVETTSTARGRPRKIADAPRASLPLHLPRIEVVITPDETACPCCGGELHPIGEDSSERLDVVPAQYRVIVTKRPKLACRACSDGVHQAAAPERLVPGGLPTEALVADVLVKRYADHLPLYRQAQALARQGIEIDRGTLALWVGRAAAELRPIVEQLKRQLLRSGRLFVDETPTPVLDPGRGTTKTGYFWTIAVDDRAHGGSDPPGVVYTYAPGRGAVHAHALLAGYTGVVQCDGYGAYKTLEDAKRQPGPVTLAFCWAHTRRQFIELTGKGPSPVADEALTRIAALYAIEARIRGLAPDERRAVRQAEARLLIDALKNWLEKQMARAGRTSPLAKALRYPLTHWTGLVRFLNDGRLELDTNTVERAIRPLTLSRKNALFAGHDLGAENWAMVASLVETCKLNGVNPQVYLADVLTQLVNGARQSRIDDLLPARWAELNRIEQRQAA